MTAHKGWTSARSAEPVHPSPRSPLRPAIVTAPPDTWHDPLELLVATRYCALTRAGYSIKDALALASQTERLLPDEVNRSLVEQAVESESTEHETSPPESQATRQPRTGDQPATAAA